jgi:hypothetical protein
MADFALWATACETALWPAGTFTRAYTANRKAAIEGIIDAHPISACVREFMSERSSWTVSAALRDKLLADVRSLSSADDAATWARRALTSKNSLAAADAELLEESFEQRLRELPPAVDTEAPQSSSVAVPSCTIRLRVKDN